MEDKISVHLTDFPIAKVDMIDTELEERMQWAQKISSLVLSMRKKSKLKVRQPLSKIMIPIIENSNFQHQIEKVKELILHEVNVKEILFVSDEDGLFTKRIKPDFKILGPKLGKRMKALANCLAELPQSKIAQLERDGKLIFTIEGEEIEISNSEVEIIADEIPGWVVANEGSLTVALDITVTDELKDEGFARELVNRIQNYRKEQNLDVVDTITITLQSYSELDSAFRKFESYIKSETLATDLRIVPTVESNDKTAFSITDEITIDALVEKN